MEPPNESNPPSLFSSLPKDIVLSILARISKSYYPTLALVSKSFRSLIISEELGTTRFYLGTQEDCLYVCLQSKKHICERRWFSLWIKPDGHEYDHGLRWTKARKAWSLNNGNMLLPVPCSYSSRLPTIQETIGSETYEISGDNTTDVWVYDKLMIGKRRKAPSMTVARKNALTCSLDGKLYVLGGCEGEESKYWAEVFDPKTQTWEPLPDPGADLRFSSLKMLQALGGNIFVRSNKNNFVYITEKSKWEVIKADLGDSMCEIDNVWYCFNGRRQCFWYDTKLRSWRLVQGLSGTHRLWYYELRTEICNYGGKLVTVWVSPATYPIEVQKICCAMISVEKHNDGEIWGHVEWEDFVLSVPLNYTLLRCIHSLQ